MLKKSRYSFGLQSLVAVALAQLTTIVTNVFNAIANAAASIGVIGIDIS
jgi:hypothetical protein